MGVRSFRPWLEGLGLRAEVWGLGFRVAPRSSLTHSLTHSLVHSLDWAIHAGRYSRFRSIAGARAGRQGSTSPLAAGDAMLAHSPQEHRAISALSPPVSGPKSAERGAHAAASGISTPPPGRVARMSQQRPGLAAAGGGEKQAAAACRKKARGGLPLEERFDHNSMYYPTVLERVAQSKVSRGGMKLHKLYGSSDGPKPKAAQVHRVPFR